jgi:phosphatidylglycerol:prolipoprotein diacylglycerol transferase
MITKVPNIPRGADIAAIGATVGMAVGRIGDIINGEHFAESTDLPWGVVYTDPDSPSFLRFGPNAAAQHPAVAYEMIGDLFIFVALLVVYFRVPRAGVTFFAWVLLYGLLRFAVSFLRLDDQILLGLTTAQTIALAAIPIGLGGITYLLLTPPAEGPRAERRRRELEEPQAPASQTEEPTTG